MATKNLPRDVFLYLLSIITLAASAIALGLLVFQYIDFYFPDKLDFYFSRSGLFSTIRGAMATLIVVFPVYFWTVWFLRKDLKKNPEKRDLKIRRWLLYFTLFVAGLVIIGDLVTLIRYFLEGELSMRFGLKILTILFIAGSIFGHYFNELRDKARGWVSVTDKLAAAVVAFAVIGGFVVAGSPQSQRLVRFDERRVSDLTMIQSQIINHWQRKQSLPANLGQLRDDISGFTVPIDPDTGAAYEYKVLAERKFQLCAQFNTSNLDYQESKNLPMPSRPYYWDTPASWLHDKGRVCFDREIDPQLYPFINDTGKPVPMPF